jgi:hypothetical protein
MGRGGSIGERCRLNDNQIRIFLSGIKGPQVEPPLIAEAIVASISKSTLVGSGVESQQCRAARYPGRVNARKLYAGRPNIYASRRGITPVVIETGETPGRKRRA